MTETQIYQFDADIDVAPLEDARWSADISPRWSAIGGQPNGGYLLAVALAATSRALPGGEPLSTSAHYLKPATIGPANIDVQIIKRGRLKSTVTATLSQDGTERLRLLATYVDRATLGWPIEFSVKPPEIAGPLGCLAPRISAGAEVTIADRFDYRVTPTTWWVQGNPSGTARIEGWIRFSDGREADLASLPLFLDAFAPSIYEVVEVALVPTIELTVHLRQRPAPGWLQARFKPGRCWGESSRRTANCGIRRASWSPCPGSSHSCSRSVEC